MASIRHLIQPNGYHRIELTEGERTIEGHGAPYTQPAMLQHNGQVFIAFTAYWDGMPGLTIELPYLLRSPRSEGIDIQPVGLT